MEKGSFHTSVPSPIVQSLDEAVKKVPLPTQLPKGIDFSELPANALRSSTLESLIDQNEDLMARLTIALRRNNEFEDNISYLEKENASMKQRFETLKEQFLLLQEKDRISTSRNLQLHEEGAEARRRAEKLEKLYTELYVQAQAFQKLVIRLERDKARILRAARSLQKRAKNHDQLLNELDHTAESHRQTVRSYESKFASAQIELEAMRTKIAEYDRVYADKVRAENQLIQEQRQSEISRQEAQDKVEHLAQENGALRSEVKELLVALEADRQEKVRLSAELPNLRQERQNLIEQVESLQALWNHKQRELETVEEKNKALQKLNQSISTTLNQQRKEIHNLQQEVEQERFTSGEKIKTLLAEIQMLRQQLVAKD